MVKIIFDEEAKTYINENRIKSLTVFVEQLPCGCVRPKEVTRVAAKTPEDVSGVDTYNLGDIKVYLKKGLKIPQNKIEIKLGTLGKERVLYPIGIEYFNGMGNYCELPAGDN